MPGTCVFLPFLHPLGEPEQVACALWVGFSVKWGAYPGECSILEPKKSSFGIIWFVKLMIVKNN